MAEISATVLRPFRAGNARLILLPGATRSLPSRLPLAIILRAFGAADLTSCSRLWRCLSLNNRQLNHREARVFRIQLRPPRLQTRTGVTPKEFREHRLKALPQE